MSPTERERRKHFYVSLFDLLSSSYRGNINHATFFLFKKDFNFYMLLAWNLTEMVMEVTFIEKWSNISFCSYQDLWVFQRYKISYLLSM